MFLLSRMGPDTDYLTVVRNMMIVGLGLGPTMPVFTLAAQNAVSFDQLGVVTSLTQFARSIGGTLGAAHLRQPARQPLRPGPARGAAADRAALIPPEQLARIQNPQVLLNPQIAEASARGWRRPAAGGPGVRCADRRDPDRRWRPRCTICS